MKRFDAVAISQGGLAEYTESLRSGFMQVEGSVGGFGAGIALTGTFALGFLRAHRPLAFARACTCFSFSRSVFSSAVFLFQYLQTIVSVVANARCIRGMSLTRLHCRS